MRGSKPGERRGGRKKGVPNKATADIRAAAQKAAPEALKELVRLATKAESEQTRVAAAKEILDRAYGRSHQHIVGEHTMTTNAPREDVSAAFISTPGGGAPG